MREKPDGVGDADMRTEGESKRIDLSVPQVAGSALAAVVAAKLASSFGVYGTILGAGLISVVATCGGSVLQHFFKRTGEQLRVRRTAEASVGGAHPGGRTAPVPGEFTQGTVYRARARGWKRPVVAAALVFGVTMAGITAYELASGHSLSGGRSTTVGSALTGHDSASGSEKSDEPSDSEGGGASQDSQDSGDTGGAGDSEGPAGSGSGDDAPAATPSGTPGGTADSTPSGDGSAQDGGTAADPTPTPDATGDGAPGETANPDAGASATAPEPGASSRSGTADPGQGGPAAP
ncbi:hypothetical protein ACIGO6_10080 [Streptomyces sp. NPDC053750]|uniref:hypothetical protein n=1 Tax=Streptomyces sp. NPDC053750 TaxID=3365714 RepID=UPI0037D5DC02